MSWRNAGIFFPTYKRPLKFLKVNQEKVMSILDPEEILPTSSNKKGFLGIGALKSSNQKIRRFKSFSFSRLFKPANSTESLSVRSVNNFSFACASSSKRNELSLSNLLRTAISALTNRFFITGTIL